MTLILRLLFRFCKVNSSQKDFPDFAASSCPRFQSGGLLSLSDGQFEILGNFYLEPVPR